MYIRDEKSFEMKEFELPYYVRYGDSVLKISIDNILEFSPEFGRSYEQEQMVALLPELFQYGTEIDLEEFQTVREKFLLK